MSNPLEQANAAAPAARPAWLAPMLWGTLVGLVTCQVTALPLRLYALSRLPEQSDAGERFAVNMEVMGMGSLALLGSLLLTVIVAVRWRGRMRRNRSGSIRRIAIAIGVAAAAGLVLNGGADNGFYLTMVLAWILLHGFGVVSAS